MWTAAALLLAALLLHAAAPAQSRTATAATVRALLRELDAELGRGDVDAMVRRFEADHAGSLSIWARHLRALAARGASCRSELVGEPRQIGDRTVAFVRHRFRLPHPAPGIELVESSYLALRSDPAHSTAVPTFAISMPAGTEPVPDERFVCPACNYGIGGVAGFLCVPLARERALALEAATFYLLGTDVAVDIEVQLADAEGATDLAADARKAARDLAGALQQLEPSARPGLVEPWLPVAQRAQPAAGIDGARIEVELPVAGADDAPARDALAKDGAPAGDVARFHVVLFGGLQHIVLVRGSAANVRRHQARIDALLQSYELLETDCDLVARRAVPLRHHTGGVLDGVNYRNERYRVAFDGPAGWRAEPRVGGAMFRARWTSPSGSRIWLTGYTRPAGVAAWSTQLATRWLLHHCNRNQLERLDASDAPPPWHALPDGGEATTWQLRVAATDRLAQPQHPNRPQRRTVHVQVFDDLLLVLDAYAAVAADSDAVAAAPEQLRRR